MVSRKPLLTAVSLAVLGLTTGPSIGASPNANHTMYVTFNRPVALPGVTLGSGTYIFEAPEATGDHNLVRVLSRDRSTVFLTTFTRAVDRSARMKRDEVISFGEGSVNGAPPIAIWWPQDSMGRRYIYPQQ